MRILNVGDVVKFLRELFDSNSLLQDLWVQGQISNVTRSPQGHYYFTLKDRETQLNCVLFRQNLDLAPVPPINGMAAVVHGRVAVYEQRGLFQLVADLIQPEGIGKLHLQYEQLKQRLNREGLFDQRRKRPLPKFPRRIGVVTSPTGAVFHDICNVVRRKFPACQIVLAPAYVSGEQAAPSVVAALRALDAARLVQVTIVARGGGSLEELWPFNDERVARAIFGSKVPVISAVGHQTDVTIADLVADVRAPTPSVAAELAVPDLEGERARLREYQSRLDAVVPERIDRLRTRVRQLRTALESNSPAAQLRHDRARVASLQGTLQTCLQHAVAIRRERTAGLQAQLTLMNPYATLERGYAITYDTAGHVVTSAAGVHEGDELSIRLRDGQIETRVSSGRAVAAG